MFKRSIIPSSLGLVSPTVLGLLGNVRNHTPNNKKACTFSNTAVRTSNLAK
jgi:hypothetical protein